MAQPPPCVGVDSENIPAMSAGPETAVVTAQRRLPWRSLWVVSCLLLVAGLGYVVQIAAPRIETVAVLAAPQQEYWQAEAVESGFSQTPTQSQALWLHTAAPQFELVIDLRDGGRLLLRREFRMLSLQHQTMAGVAATNRLVFTRFDPPRHVTCERSQVGWSLRLGGSEVVQVLDAEQAQAPVSTVQWAAAPEQRCAIRTGAGRAMAATGQPVKPVWNDLAIALQQRLLPTGDDIAAQVHQQHAALATIDTASAALSGRGRKQHWLPPEGRFVAALLPAVLRAPLGGEALRPADMPEWADAWLAMASGNAIASTPPPVPPVLGVPGFHQWWQSVESLVMPRDRWSTVVATAAIRRALQQQQNAAPGSEQASVASLVALVRNDYDRWLLIDLLQRLAVYPTTVTTPEPLPQSEPLRWLLRQPQQAAWSAAQPRREPITGDASLDPLLQGAPSARLWTRPGPKLPPSEALACWLLARQRAGLPADWSLLPLLPSVVLPLELLMPPAAAQ